jgi:2-polyprenyl-3-methyl-5-hydroxy-6-metoxy-1,4-benzoquinol methylase
MTTTTDRAFHEYGVRSLALDGPEEARQRWFDAHVRETYRPHLGPETTTRICEVGFNRGFMLRSLQQLGFRNLAGVDLSPQDVEDARRRTGIEGLVCGDAVEFLRARPGSYDAVIFKAVLEHVPKAQAGPLLDAIGGALRPQGVVLCEVPNMDWYFASHERYMDVTHETGFTPESLAQLFGLYFDDVKVLKVTDPSHGPLASRRRRFARRVIFHLVRRVMNWAGEDMSIAWFEHRSILAVARRPRVTP